MADSSELNLTIKARDEASQTLRTVSRNVSDSGKVADDTSKHFKIAGAAIAAVGVGLTAYAKNATDATVEYVAGVNRVSRVTGEGVEQASRLQYAFQRMGVDATASSQIFGLFSRKIAEAGDASKASTSKLTELNVKVKDSAGFARSFSEILLDVADRFAAMPNGADKSAAALELFGRQGLSLLPILNKGSEGIKKLQEDADRLGLTLSTSNVEAVKKYTQSQKDLKDSSTALKIAVGTLTAPVLAEFNNRINGVAQSFLRTEGPVRDATINVLAFGGPVATAAGAVIGFGANLRTMAAGLNMAAVASRAFQIATGPVGWAILAVGAAISSTLYLFGGHKKATEDSSQASAQQASVEERLNEQLEINKRNLDNATQATKALGDAKFDQLGSALSVERAQRSYNEAVAEYGPSSLEAREASYNLEQSKLRLQEATDKVTEAQNLQNIAEGNLVIATPDVTSSIQLRIDKFSGLVSRIDDARRSVVDLDVSTAATATKLQGSVQTLQSNVQKLQSSNSALSVQGAAGGLQGGRSNLQGRASGGYVQGGTAYRVGEQGEEIFVPGQSGNIINARDTAALDQGGRAPSYNFTFNIGGNVVGNEGALRGLAVQMAQMVDQALRGQGTDSVSQLRTAA
jgi:outer membrane murein-binding lipoprotein Lpp